VAGTDITLRLWYFINDANATIDYTLLVRYANESTSLTNVINPTDQWTANAVANRPNKEDITITGTNLSPGDILNVKVDMGDNGGATAIVLHSGELIIPVNTRT